MTTHKWRSELKYGNLRCFSPLSTKSLMTPRQCPDNYDMWGMCGSTFSRPGYIWTIAGIWHAARHDASSHDMALEIAFAGVGFEYPNE